MSNQKDIELIESYLQRMLNDKEYQSVLNRIEVDKDFAGRFKEEEIIYKVIADDHAQGFLFNLRSVMNDSNGQVSFRKKIFNLRNIVMGIAASILIVAISFLLLREKALSNDQLYAQYYKTYPLITIERGPSDEVLKKLNQHYADKAWNEVLTDLSTVRGAGMMDIPLTDLYEGISYLNLDQPGQAIAVLEKYKSSPANPMMQETLLWYLSLAYLAADKGTEAKETLKTLGVLLSPDSVRAKEVKTLLDEIK